MGEKLTLKQKLFVERYLVHKNGLLAAREAGYDADDATLRSIASENLTKPNIMAEIERRVVRPEIMSANQVLEKLTEIGSASWNEFVQVKMKDGLVIDAILPLKDQLKALELLGKYHALYTEKIIVSELDREFEEQLAKIIAGTETDSSINPASETIQ